MEAAESSNRFWSTSSEYASHYANLSEGRHVMLAVTDTGLGIPKELVARIFESFSLRRSSARAPGWEKHTAEIALMITDVTMLEMIGRQLASELSREFPRMKVLYVSGYTEDSVVHHGVLEPGIHFLAKPFTPTALAQKIRKVLATA